MAKEKRPLKSTILMELLMRFDLPPVDIAMERGTTKFKHYQNALAEYDNGRIAALIDFWQDRFSDTFFT